MDEATPLTVDVAPSRQEDSGSNRWKWATAGGAATLLVLGMLGLSESSSTLFSQTTPAEMLQMAEQESTAIEGTVSSAPNIILFTVDDMGWNDVGFNSIDMPKATPFIDMYKEQGLLLTHYYTQPSCTPSRSTIMSGMFVHKTGYANIEVQHQSAYGMPLSFKLMPQFMRELGYRTYGYGKWNIGHCNVMYLPHERGFNHYLGYNCPGHGYSDYICGLNAGVRDMYEGFSELEDGEWKTSYELGPYEGIYDTELYRNMAGKAIRSHVEEHAGVPLFMWLAHHGVHGTYDSQPEPPETLLTEANKEYLEYLSDHIKETEDYMYEMAGIDPALAENSKDKGTLTVEKFFSKRKITASLVMSIDNAFKDLIETLEEVGIMDNTFVFFNSDNGGDPNTNVGHPGSNWPYRGEKFFYLEGGIRAPAFVYAPGLLPSSRVGQTFNGLMHHVDLIPTFVSLAGGNAHKMEKNLDGIDMVPALYGESDEHLRTEIVFSLPRSGAKWKLSDPNFQNENAALRMGHYKMVITDVSDKRFLPVGWMDAFLNQACTYGWYRILATEDACGWTNHLYNLENDPYEKNNLWDSEDEEVQAMKQKMLIRIHELLETESTGYPEKLYVHNKLESSKFDYDTIMKNNDYWLGPWDCDVIA